MVQRITEALPMDIQDLVTPQLHQLNSMKIPCPIDAAAISLEGDQYIAYTTVT